MAADRSAASPSSSRKAGGAKAVGAYLPKVAKAVFAAHGFPGVQLLAEWPAIAGTEFAAYTAPEKLIWPRRVDEGAREDQTMRAEQSRRPAGATLVLRVDGPRALEVQHGAPQIMERVNTYFGYRAVASLRIVQGPVRNNTVPQPAPPPAPLPDETGLGHIDDEGLRSALARLGGQISEDADR